MNDALNKLVAEAKSLAGNVVETHAVEAVNAASKRSLYQKRIPIHPKRMPGTFRRLKWIVLLLLLGIYYITPWLRWDRGEGVPDQAVLFDLATQRFFFFGIEIWPQEVYYITGILILGAIGLFLATSIAGRVWCGYTCPQTVWTDLFIAIEKALEGERNQRIKLDRAPWTFNKIWRRFVKHVLWVLVAIATGGAWVFYFADAPTLMRDLLTFSASSIAYITIGILTFTTYMLGGFAREQVCTYMCPWPRIQGAMLDEESLAVTYRRDRGEKRGPHKKGETWDGRGDCVDCMQCVAVCPTGIDIRDGLQLECIQCALCIDACNDIMDKVGRPRGLIAYDTDANVERRAQNEPEKFRFVRPRTVGYAAFMLIVSAVMAYGLLTRSPVELGVERDRNPLFVTLSDGSVRNGYTVKIQNRAHTPAHFQIGVTGIPDADIHLMGFESNDTAIEIAPDRMRAVKIFVSRTRDSLTSDSTPLTVTVTDVRSNRTYRHTTSFKGPKPE